MSLIVRNPRPIALLGRETAGAGVETVGEDKDWEHYDDAAGRHSDLVSGDLVSSVASASILVLERSSSTPPDRTPAGGNIQHVHRDDVQQLRGVSILLVLFAHAGLPGFSNGFVSNHSRIR